MRIEHKRCPFWDRAISPLSILLRLYEIITRICNFTRKEYSSSSSVGENYVPHTPTIHTYILQIKMNETKQIHFVL